MKTTYFDDDTLVIHLSDKPVTKVVQNTFCKFPDGEIESFGMIS